MSQPRTLLHTRHVTCTAYLREDGLLDVEGEMRDITPVDTDLLFRVAAAGGDIHHMHMTMTLDRDLVIQHVLARTHAGPTPYCQEIESAYGALEGLKIAPGFLPKVKARVGGIRGCTHLTELLGPMATTAYQARFALMRKHNHLRQRLAGGQPLPRPALVDSCHTYRLDGEAIQLIWPEDRRQGSDHAVSSKDD
ncbi:DUF2889 domain-containing protein [Metapseudomonas lalkuanensis]|uniref:DUF2889 domain-containing protein n=1 Tax=Metapseudomonas lalkuanensis TaxID=2604832 RepID=A0A5J6QQD0_9GAMM|nr:DUF2889 domain-containing protein [Pseudomonas lalkuanensis]QEY62946.1 DUF2889 domain-containing protein [Pseudomonas lalkuanensis]